MTTKHTAGPWEVHGDNHTLIGATDGKMMLCQAWHHHPTHKEWDRTLPEAQANAALMAASPDLLAALEACEQFLSAWGRANTKPGQAETLANQAVRDNAVIFFGQQATQARAAIAKAKGGKQS